MFPTFIACCLGIGLALAQSPPTPSGLTILQSKLRSGVSISYKQSHICETTPNVRSFSGYVHLPSNTLGDIEGGTPYNMSMFFWFFESRNDPHNSPLSIYLAGGPGASSLTAATYESGPCYINNDSNSTTLNPWSWNNHVNMLYIDQPVQVGFSYTSLVNSTLDIFSNAIAPIDPQNPVQADAMHLAGVLPDQNMNFTANNTQNSARTLWHFAQTWFTEFPEYNTTDKHISVWGNSYGGYYVPGTVAYFQEQNERIKNGTIDTPNAVHLELDTLGITNGCIDALVSGLAWPDYAFNNTYGFQGIPEDVYHDAVNNFTKPGGCKDLTLRCRELGAIGDPMESGSNDTVNAACALATEYCWTYVQGPFVALSGRSAFDISRNALSAFPPEYSMGYFNQRWVQEDLGVPLNYTIGSPSVQSLFFGVTGDFLRRTIEPLNYAVRSGVKASLIFGDRDYRCNWYSGEAISLAMEYPEQTQFHAAGYANITVNSTYQGGLVRQHNNVSFSRVFEAGHAVSAFQPETVYQIFMRAMFNKDVATGQISIGASDTGNATGYSSSGPTDSRYIKNVLPPSPPNECYTWAPSITCTDEQLQALNQSTAVINNYIVVGINNETASTM